MVLLFVGISKKYIVLDVLSKFSYYRLLESIFYPSYNPVTFNEKEALNFIGPNFIIKSTIGTKSIPIINRIFPFTGKSVIFILEKC